MANALMTTYEAAGQMVQLDAQTVREYLVNGSGRPSDQEVAMFINLCQYQGLNPFLREAYLIKYSDKAPASTVVGKDAFTRRARQIPECKGYSAGVAVMDKAGNYAEREGAIVLPGEKLVGGWCEVYSDDWEKPFKSTASLQEYNQGNSMWNGKPATMIRKVALVQALREAFPDKFQGMYDQSEMPVRDEMPEGSVDTSKKAEKPQKKQPAKNEKVVDIAPLITAEQATIIKSYITDKATQDVVVGIIKSYGFASIGKITADKFDAICAKIEELLKFVNDEQGLKPDELESEMAEAEAEAEIAEAMAGEILFE